MQRQMDGFFFGTYASLRPWIEWRNYFYIHSLFFCCGVDDRIKMVSPAVALFSVVRVMVLLPRFFQIGTKFPVRSCRHPPKVSGAFDPPKVLYCSRIFSPSKNDEQYKTRPPTGPLPFPPSLFFRTLHSPHVRWLSSTTATRAALIGEGDVLLLSFSGFLVGRLVKLEVLAPRCTNTRNPSETVQASQADRLLENLRCGR